MSSRNSYHDISTSIEYKKVKIRPPWCSSGKVPEKRKLPLKRDIQSSYPLRENIWEFLHDGKNSKCCSKRQNEKTDKVKNRRRKTKKLLLVLLVMSGLIVILERKHLPNTYNWLGKIKKNSPKLFTFAWEDSSVGEQCFHKMKLLALELSRAEQILRKSFRYRMTMSALGSKPVVEVPRHSQYIAGASASMGSGTEEWWGRMYLWGIIPLWRTASPPHTVLAELYPTPGDCWPFSGSSGELHIQLPSVQCVKSISIEHVQPDTARSAPNEFVAYGVLVNGTRIELMENEYRRYGPPKQYFPIFINTPVQSVIVKVLSNQGNTKYTCIYRVHLHG